MTQLSALLFIGTALAILLNGCAQVEVKDEVLYALRGAGNGAFVAHTLNSTEASLTQPEWDAIATGKLCMSTDAFADYKEIIEKLCSYNPSECTYEQQDQLQSFSRHLHKLQVKIKKGTK